MYRGARLAHSLRFGIKFLRATNRVGIRDDDLVTFDFFLFALRSIEGSETSHIDAYEAAAADPFLKIITIGAFRCIKDGGSENIHLVHELRYQINRSGDQHCSPPVTTDILRRTPDHGVIFDFQALPLAQYTKVSNPTGSAPAK